MATPSIDCAGHIWSRNLVPMKHKKWRDHLKKVWLSYGPSFRMGLTGRCQGKEYDREEDLLFSSHVQKQNWNGLGNASSHEIYAWHVNLLIGQLCASFDPRWHSSQLASLRQPAWQHRPASIETQYYPSAVIATDTGNNMAMILNRPETYTIASSIHTPWLFPLALRPRSSHTSPAECQSVPPPCGSAPHRTE
eukprot:scaffold667420_cov60-Prasinocladus_malaysianus.AAC.1